MNVFINDASLQDIAGAIREKTGGTAAMKPGEMAAAIRGIESGGMEINGVVRNALVAAGAAISVGDFVENKGYETDVSTFYGPRRIAMGNANEMGFPVVPLEDGRVMFLYARTDTNSGLAACIGDPKDQFYQFIGTGFAETANESAVGAIHLGGDRVLAVFGSEDRTTLYGTILSVPKGGMMATIKKTVLNTEGGIYRPALAVCKDGTVLVCARYEIYNETAGKAEGKMWACRLRVSGEDISVVGSGWFTSKSDDAVWTSNDSMLLTPTAVFPLAGDQAMVFHEGADHTAYMTTLTLSTAGITERDSNPLNQFSAGEMVGYLQKSNDTFCVWYKIGTSFFVNEVTSAGGTPSVSTYSVRLSDAGTDNRAIGAVVLPNGNIAVVYSNTKRQAVAAEIVLSSKTVKVKTELDVHMMQPPHLCISANGNLMVFCFEDAMNCSAKLSYSGQTTVVGAYNTKIFGVAKADGTVGKAIEIYVPK